MTAFVTAAVNGNRDATANVGVPVTPADLAAAVREAVGAGADAVHFHCRRPDGTESIAAEDIAIAVLAIRATAPEARIGTTTGLWTCDDSHTVRMERIRGWQVGTRPDFASVAFSEPGADEAAALLLEMGLQVESAVWSIHDVAALVHATTLHRHVRVLIEPEDTAPEAAVDHARRMAAAIRAGGYRGPLQYHGLDATAWPVLQASADDQRNVRIGLEDTVRLPSGIAAGNEELVRAARRILSAGAAGSRHDP